MEQLGWWYVASRGAAECPTGRSLLREPHHWEDAILMSQQEHREVATSSTTAEVLLKTMKRRARPRRTQLPVTRWMM